ncbi:MAG: thiamine pyrophosphate-binding protein [Hyphomicrobiaceae bacterium]|nr:thiamine pyrophosphate-binding protein [Hyphomicrobiaceae bacterium]
MPRMSGASNRMPYNSDAVAALLRSVGMKYVALCPGSSYRGLHESLVNFLGNRDPEMLLCLHEEHAVAIAHGYAKVAPEPMGVLVHANVGLMHATMTIYNAFCDRAPVIVMAGTAALDAAKRTVPAHWQHSVLDLGDLVRTYVKWDDQPISLPATCESILRAWNVAQTAPRGPVFLSLDQRLQEERNENVETLPDASRYRPGAAALPRPELIREAAGLLAGAARPVILAGRVSRSEAAWGQRIELAEMLGADVFTDLKTGAAFPTDHSLHAAQPSLGVTTKPGAEKLRGADVVLSLDWVDMGNLFRFAWPEGPPQARIIRCSVDRHIHNGWSREHQGLVPVDVDLLAEPCDVVPLLIAQLQRDSGQLTERAAARRQRREAEQRPPEPRRAPEAPPDSIGLWDLGVAFAEVIRDKPATVARLPLGWHADAWPMRHPLDYLGYDGAGGIGSGPGMGVGAALALRGSGRLAVVMVGDGDFLMGASALWTAAHHRIPLLMIVANNAAYHVDEVHQRTVSRQRNRPVDKAWVGQRIDDPEADLVKIAEGFGSEGESVASRGALLAALRRAVAAVDAGGRFLLDVRILHDYQPDAS